MDAPCADYKLVLIHRRKIEVAVKVDEREMDSYYIPERVKEIQTESKNVDYLILILGSIFILVDVGVIIWIVVKSKQA